MLPSEKLRKEISQKFNINLEQYAWPEELKQCIFSIKLDKDLESHADTLEEIYSLGFNIGHCGLTSRYIAIQFPTATMHYGTASLLTGTKDSPNGEHAWTILNDFLIDSTLMIMIPIRKIEELRYKEKLQLAQDSARMLSEYDRYDNDYNEQEKKRTL